MSGGWGVKSMSDVTYQSICTVTHVMWVMWNMDLEYSEVNTQNCANRFRLKLRNRLLRGTNASLGWQRFGSIFRRRELECFWCRVQRRGGFWCLAQNAFGHGWCCGACMPTTDLLWKHCWFWARQSWHISFEIYALIRIWNRKAYSAIHDGWCTGTNLLQRIQPKQKMGSFFHD